MPEHYRHLGIFSDWVAVPRRAQPLCPPALPGPHKFDLEMQSAAFDRFKERL